MSQERTVSYVLITGTTSGLGREFARIFAQNGYNIVAVARNEILLQQQKQELERHFGIEMVYVVKDLSTENSAQEVYDEIKHKGINIDILINNAGFGSFGRYIDVDWQRQKGLASVNMLAVMQLSYLFGKDWIVAVGVRLLILHRLPRFKLGRTWRCIMPRKLLSARFLKLCMKK